MKPDSSLKFVLALAYASLFFGLVGLTRFLRTDLGCSAWVTGPLAFAAGVLICNRVIELFDPQKNG
jgi:hypothetical protein